MIRLWLATVLLVFLSARSGWAQPADASPGERAAWGFVGNLVHIRAENFGGADGAEEDGYGFVVGQENGSAVVVTADHVVRQDNGAATRITVQFMREQGRQLTATLLQLRLPPESGDLAILEVPIPPGLRLQWPQMVPSYELVLGTPAWRIGKAGRAVPARQPGSFVGRFGAVLLEFDDLDTPSGSSGGPIIGEHGLIGMVVADGGLAGVPARVLPIDTIGAMLRSWQLPWQIQPPQGAVTASVVPPPAAIPERPPPPKVLLPVVRPQSRAEMEQVARDVVQRLFDAMSEPSATAVATLNATYAATVLHNGTLARRADLLADEVSFFDQWPLRRYQVRPGSMRLDCNLPIAACRVEAAVNWARRSNTARTQTGQTQFIFSVGFSAAGPLVLAQTDEMSERR